MNQNYIDHDDMLYLKATILPPPAWATPNIFENFSIPPACQILVLSPTPPAKVGGIKTMDPNLEWGVKMILHVKNAFETQKTEKRL